MTALTAERDDPSGLPSNPFPLLLTGIYSHNLRHLASLPSTICCQGILERSLQREQLSPCQNTLVYLVLPEYCKRGSLERQSSDPMALLYGKFKLVHLQDFNDNVYFCGICIMITASTYTQNVMLLSLVVISRCCWFNLVKIFLCLHGILQNL